MFWLWTAGVWVEAYNEAGKDGDRTEVKGALLQTKEEKCNEMFRDVSGSTKAMRLMLMLLTRTLCKQNV